MLGNHPLPCVRLGQPLRGQSQGRGCPATAPQSDQPQCPFAATPTHPRCACAARTPAFPRFHVPAEEAAKAMRVSLTVLKRIARKNGITR